ncbi:hypothetical protein TNCT_160031 [Trichonephila clavata]|uniref:Uncharacterized protein n=1 Tax=Trichonephila clavata TaxID=2740835 RepID=A0A8X6FF06_TRICU|nr:hypothetical protein TNCT_160031 [Trichonephila clavata]
MPYRPKDCAEISEIIPYLCPPSPATFEIFSPSQHREQSDEKFHWPSPLVTNEATFPPPVVGALQTRRGQLSDKSSIGRTPLVHVTDESPHPLFD